MKLIIVDKTARRQNNAVLWDERSNHEDYLSLPSYVDEHGAELRRRYIAWVYELGLQRVNGKHLHEIFSLDGVPLWWMSKIVEKSPQSSPQLFTLFKLLALEMIITDKKVDSVDFHTADRHSHDLIKDFCKQLGVSYSHVGVFAKQDWVKSIGGFLRRRHILLALRAWLSYFKHALKTERGSISFSNNSNQATIVTYFPNIDIKMAEKGVHNSSYWGDLDKVVLESCSEINWVLLFHENKHYTYEQSRTLCKRFNEHYAGKQRFVLLGDFLTIKLLLIAAKSYLKSLIQFVTMRSLHVFFRLTDSNYNFHNLLKDDLVNSFTGSRAMHNCIQSTLYFRLIECLPPQKLGLYVWENQPWEKALILAWRQQSASASIIGCQHATMVYFDMRHLEDPRAFDNRAFSALQPDCLAVNSHGSLNLLKETNYPASHVKPVEALRYLYLSNLSNVQRPSKALLILTGYHQERVHDQLQLLEAILDNGIIDRFDEFIIKSHPYFPIEAILLEYPKTKKLFSMTYSSLAELLSEKATVYCDNHTSAVIESLYAGAKTIVHKPSDGFDLCPISNEGGITYVASSSELRDSLNENVMKADQAKPNYFILDQSLIQWKNLLKENARHVA